MAVPRELTSPTLDHTRFAVRFSIDLAAAMAKMHALISYLI